MFLVRSEYKTRAGAPRAHRTNPEVLQPALRDGGNLMAGFKAGLHDDKRDLGTARAQHAPVITNRGRKLELIRTDVAVRLKIRVRMILNTPPDFKGPYPLTLE